MTSDWVTCKTTLPKLFTTVWITYKKKTEIAYLDNGTPPEWHLIKNGKSVSLEKVSAWMVMREPKPYEGSK